MKKYIYRIFIIVVILLIFGLKNVYAAIYDWNMQINNKPTDTIYAGITLEGTKSFIKNLGCKDYDDEKWFELDTKISFSDNEEEITIGNVTKNIGKENYKKLKEQVENKEVRLRFEIMFDFQNGSPAGETNVNIILTNIYTDSDKQGSPKKRR